jgi:malonate-semialdehyde dehydrogenase (acetylating)/methylmalonate-semialdehyde dehydrogenase
MGGKNHALVTEDADITDAVAGIMSAAFGSTGQRCMAISVVVVIGDRKRQEQIAQEICSKA